MSSQPPVPDPAAVPEPWLTRFKTLGAVQSSAVKAVALVGGCVRDMMLSRDPYDWDVMVEGDIGRLLKEGEVRFRVSKTVRHPAFLTATLHFEDGTLLDVVTARRETYPRPAALPDVRPAPLADDFRRRDFTVNAMALLITPGRWGELLDPLGGRRDLAAGLIRILHDESFDDDPTRIFRAARYAGRYGWAVEPDTLDRLRAAVKRERPSLLSAARRRNELVHLLEEPSCARAMELLWTWGLWSSWSPRWRWTPETARALGDFPGPDRLAPRLAALCRAGSAEQAADDLRALSFPKKIIQETLAALVSDGR